MCIQKKYYVFLLAVSLIFGLNTATLAQEIEETETGIASWYGSKYHGRPTSSGERYNKHQLTAAHNELPFGTIVKVTNLDNNKSVTVRINDRGPFKGKRVIDLSEAAARKIGMINSGLSEVEIEILDLPGSDDDLESAQANNSDRTFTIQAGAFASEDNAQRLAQRILSLDSNLHVILKKTRVNGRIIHQVYAGRYEDRDSASKLLQKLSQQGINGLIREEA